MGARVPEASMIVRAEATKGAKATAGFIHHISRVDEVLPLLAIDN